MKKLYLILILVIVGCNKNKFKLPVGYDLVFSEEDTFKSYNFEDSITENYDSVNILKKPFKAIGDYYLLKKNNSNDSILKLYDNAIPFKVYKISNDESKVIKLNYYLEKNYNPKLYSKNRNYPNVKLISLENVSYEYNKMLNESKSFRVDGNDSSFTMYNHLKKAFTEKYGNYNLLITNIYNLDGLPAKTVDLVWYRNGVKIKLSFEDSEEDKWFDFEHVEGFYSDYYIKYKSTQIRVSFEDLNEMKKMRNSISQKEEIKEKDLLRIKNGKKELENQKVLYKKKKIDSISKQKTDFILEKM